MNWLPMSVVCLRYYDRARFRADVFAGLNLFLQLLPLAVAIAIAVGLHPLYGLSCAAVSGFVASALGESKIQVTAPNVVFVAVAANIVVREGILGLAGSTFLAGVLLVMFGVSGLGTALRSLPRSVTLGFSTGIGIVVARMQLPGLLGSGQQHSLDASRIEPHAMALAVPAFMLLVAGGRGKSRSFPVALLVLTLGAWLTRLAHWPVRTVATLAGSDLIAFHLPPTVAGSLARLGPVISLAFALAVLIAIESLQARSVAASLSGEQISADGELCVQGMVGVASAFAGGLPASGVSSYTSENARRGAQTPVAGILNTAFFLVFLLSASPVVRFIPMPLICALILACVCNMAHWREIPAAIKASRADAVAWLATSILTIIADLPMAIAAGMLFSIYLYVRRP